MTYNIVYLLYHHTINSRAPARIAEAIPAVHPAVGSVLGRAPLPEAEGEASSDVPVADPPEVVVAVAEPDAAEDDEVLPIASADDRRSGH
jgi:hypothetical protein